MTTFSHVTDFRSNIPDQIANAARFIGKKNTHRRRVFDAIYYGKKAHKKASEIVKTTGLPLKRVLDAGKRLADTHYVGQTKVDGETAYIKDSTIKQFKRRIQAYADDPKRLSQVATKTHPKVSIKLGKLSVARSLIKVKEITIDDLEQFARIKKVKKTDVGFVPMTEAKFKKGIQRLLGEPGKFQDWGGEQNDLFTTRVRLNGRRIPAAFAFKGRGKKGILTPNMMGKNGDQIPRLFRSPARVYFVQYWGQVHETIYDLMKTYASNRSVSDGDKVYYGIIDGTDSARIIQAYPKRFR